MKKAFLILLLVLLSIQNSYSQSQKEITILYLIPLHLSDSLIDINKIDTDMDIYEIPSFEMFGFWEGAKMALQSYENGNKNVKVVVRDVTTDETKLEKIFQDEKFMKDVDLIIGPFYGSLFPIASKYAKDHKITIINPFSTRTNFVSENSAVYKLTPPLNSRPESLQKNILTKHPDYSVILWYDSEDNVELAAYETYFKTNEIPYTLTKVKPETYSLNLTLSSTKHNVIIALFQNQTNVINQMRLLEGIKNQFQFSLIFPEEWLQVSSLDDDFYAMPNIYYFSNYYVDQNSSTVMDFKSDYVTTYHSPCQLERYSYQGYDITKYFIDLFFVGYNFKNVTYKPMSYKFKFKQWTSGGFENDKVRLIEIKNFEKVEVE